MEQSYDRRREVRSVRIPPAGFRSFPETCRKCWADVSIAFYTRRRSLRGFPSDFGRNTCGSLPVFRRKTVGFTRITCGIPADYMRNSRGLHADFPRITCGVRSFRAFYPQNRVFAGLRVFCVYFCVSGAAFLRVFCGLSAGFLRVFFGFSAGGSSEICGRLSGNLRAILRNLSEIFWVGVLDFARFWSVFLWKFSTTKIPRSKNIEATSRKICASWPRR